MWNSSSSSSARDVWKIIQDELLVGLERECVQMAVNASHADENHTIHLGFDELTERTGLDFRSTSDNSVRSLLYANRVEIAQSYRLYFTSEYAVGLKFTANPWLGMKWREEFELERSHTKADVTEQLWAIAERQVPFRLRQAVAFFRRDASTRMKQLETTMRQHQHKFKQLESGGSQN